MPTTKQALQWVEQQGIVLQSARGPVPSFAEWVAGEKIRGSWWGHPKSLEIFRLSESVIDSGDVLICKLINGKVTYVHRRLWAALVRLASKFKPEQIAEVKSVHTPSGKHELVITPYPKWVPVAIKKEARSLKEKEAIAMMGDWITYETGGLLNPEKK